MNIDLELAKLQRSTDQYRAMLRDAMISIGVTRSMEVISELEKDFHAEEDMGNKIYIHAAMVGFAVTLFEHMQAEIEQAHNAKKAGE